MQLFFTQKNIHWAESESSRKSGHYYAGETFQKGRIRLKFVSQFKRHMFVKLSLLPHMTAQNIRVKNSKRQGREMLCNLNRDKTSPK